MDGSWTIYPRDASRTAQVLRHPSAAPLDVLDGTASDAVDLSNYVVRCTQTVQEANVEFAFHNELYGSGQPLAGEVLELKLDGRTLWIGIVDSLHDSRLSRGERRILLTARSRDASPIWRDVPRVTPLYPVGTSLGFIARDVAAQLNELENLLPSIAATTVHSGTQLANISAWEMLTSLYQPSGFEPYVDALGRLKCISRDCTREADLILTAEQILNVTSAKSQYPTTSVKIKWLDPNLLKYQQQDKVLQTANIHAGYFQQYQRQDVYFSDDRQQRAANTRLVIKQSCNSGLLQDVAVEKYAQLSETEGRITLITKAWVPTLLADYILTQLILAMVPDVVVAWGTGYTIPVGRKVQAASAIELFLIMSSVGTGSYEVWGTPFDWVHARNTTEAYDQNTPRWLEKTVEIENDFVMNEEGAQAFAIRELIYAARAADTYNVTIVDHPGIENGDILQLPDASRLYVTSFTRDLSRSAAATVQINGFRC